MRLSDNTCICADGLFMNGSSMCVSTCSAGYYQDSITRTCVKCRDECSTCVSYNDCDICI